MRYDVKFYTVVKLVKKCNVTSLSFRYGIFELLHESSM